MVQAGTLVPAVTAATQPVATRVTVGPVAMAEAVAMALLVEVRPAPSSALVKMAVSAAMAVLADPRPPPPVLRAMAARAARAAAAA
jgi:hypothetical protein